MYTNYRAYLFKIPTTSMVFIKDRATNLYVGAETVSGWPTGTASADKDIDRTILEYIRGQFPNAEDDDIRTRLIRLWIAIEKSIVEDQNHETRMDPDAEKDVLKIFLAPEFYFVPMMRKYDLVHGVTQTGFYSASQYKRLYETIEHLLKEYSAYHDNRQLNDWIFLCGTCVYNRIETAIYRVPKLINAMIAVELGKEKKEARAIRKMVLSNIDGVSEREDAEKRLTESESFAEIENHYFSESGLYVDICLEHACRIYKGWQESVYLSRGIFPRANFRVVSAAGMKLKKSYIASNVIALRSDGSRPGDEMLEPMTQVARKDLELCFRNPEKDSLIVTEPWQDITLDIFYEALGVPKDLYELELYGSAMTPEVRRYYEEKTEK